MGLERLGESSADFEKESFYILEEREVDRQVFPAPPTIHPDP